MMPVSVIPEGAAREGADPGACADKTAGIARIVAKHARRKPPDNPLFTSTSFQKIQMLWAHTYSEEADRSCQQPLQRLNHGIAMSSRPKDLPAFWT